MASIGLVVGLSLLSIVDPEGAARAGVHIRASDGKGLGAFASRRLLFGDKIGSYDGEVLTEREWAARFTGKGRLPADERWLSSRARRGIPVTGDYVLAFGEDAIIDAEDPSASNWCRYINHDDNPNLGLFREPNAAGDHERGGFFPCFYVISDSIAVGEELSFDYGPGYWARAEEAKK